jgi:hypothetical protein
MYQRIGEKIEVAGVYNSKGFEPKRFKWQTRLYDVDQVTLRVNAKDGGRRLRLYSVMVKGTAYRLRFDRDDEQWLLEEVWYEG